MNQPSASLKGLAGLSPISRETAQDMVYNQLRTALICGGFDAGEVFKPGEVADLMRVSSMPVREALARLVSERALEAMPNRRVRVPLLNRDTMRGIVRARRLIEGELAARAFRNITSEDIAALDELTVDYEAAQSETGIARANHAFHFTIYHRAASTVLIPFAESLWMQAGPYIRTASRLLNAPLDVAATWHHQNIVRAIRSNDPDGFVAALHEDISRPFDILDTGGKAVWGEEENG